MEGGDKLAELAAELLLRGVDTDKVLEVLQSRGAAAPKERQARKPREGTERQPRLPRPGYITHEQVLGALVGRFLTVDELLKEVPGSNRGRMIRHVRTGLQLGNLVQVGKREPFAYALTKAGKAIAKQVGAAKERKAPAGTQLQLTHAGVIDKLRKIGTVTAKGLRIALGASCSDQAIRMHLRRGVFERTVKRDDSEKPATFTAVGAAPATLRGSGRKPGESNTERIVRALTTARKPLRAREFIETVPEFKDTALGTLAVALAVAAKQGAIVRVETGLYGLPKKATKSDGKRETTKKGKNDERILAALTAAKQPLDLKAFCAAIPEFKRMNAGAQTMALSKAVERGFAKRVSTGLYALPSHKAAAYTAKVRSTPKAEKPAASEPAKPASDPANDSRVNVTGTAQA